MKREPVVIALLIVWAVFAAWTALGYRTDDLNIHGTSYEADTLTAYTYQSATKSFTRTALNCEFYVAGSNNVLFRFNGSPTPYTVISHAKYNTGDSEIPIYLTSVDLRSVSSSSAVYYLCWELN